MSATSRRIYGDVQTPDALARRVCHWVFDQGLVPASVLEPTCGVGAFVEAAASTFPSATLIGVELNPDHLRIARERVPSASWIHNDAFLEDWRARLHALPTPALILGNPPWSTTSVQGAYGAANAPVRTHPTGFSGLDLLTGASNFDVSEHLVIQWLNALRTGDALAMLLKRSVVRRLIARNEPLAMEIVEFDSRRIFGAAVDAELLFARRVHSARLKKRESFESPAVEAERRLGRWVWNPAAIDHVGGVLGTRVRPSGWRSGLKHDCRRVFELTRGADGYSSEVERGLELEASTVFPFLKATDLAHGREPHRAVLVTQRSLRESPLALRDGAPRAWAYLHRHRDALRARRSRVYRDRPDFTQFGVGPYTFAQFKVAVSGLHWPPRFRALGPIDGSPVVIDDTSYAFACPSAETATDLAQALNDEAILAALTELTDPKSKRPLTAALLSHLRIAEDGTLLRDRSHLNSND